MRVLSLLLLLAAAVLGARVQVTSATNAVLYDLQSPDNTCNVAPVLSGVSWGFTYFRVHIAFVYTLHGYTDSTCMIDAVNSTLATVQPGTGVTGQVAGTNINLGTNVMLVTASAAALRIGMMLVGLVALACVQ